MLRSRRVDIFFLFFGGGWGWGGSGGVFYLFISFFVCIRERKPYKLSSRAERFNPYALYTCICTERERERSRVKNREKTSDFDDINYNDRFRARAKHLIGLYIVLCRGVRVGFDRENA